MLAAANKKKKPVFIASTSEVYGKSADLPFREDGDLLLGPTTTGRWSYACSKAIDEYLALAYWKERGLPVVIGRLFNTVGPRQTGRYGMVVPTLRAPGARRRADHRLWRRPAAALLLPREGRGARHGGPDGDRRGGGGGLQHRQHRGDHDRSSSPSACGSACDSDSEIRLVPYEEAYEAGFEDMRRRVPDIAKIGDLIGWRPTRTLDEILEDVIESQRAPEALAQSG